MSALVNHLWKCPVCGHLMTEEQSKGYRRCPSGFHAAQHQRMDIGYDSECQFNIEAGLCDDCVLPKVPQEYMGSGCMVCLDCIAGRPKTPEPPKPFVNEPGFC